MFRYKLLPMKRLSWLSLYVFGLLWALLLTGCVSMPPGNTMNACQIFWEYPAWYQASKTVQTRWHVPISVQLAIINQESHFRANAAPPRERLLWIILWKRPTTAYGYSQALDDTWKHYQQETHHARTSRSEFADAVDFIGWYATKAHQRLHIPRTNAYRLYLAYHEGLDGYKHKTYLTQPWLMDVAHKVQDIAWLYRKQIVQCQYSLDHMPTKSAWWHIWP